MFDGASAFNQPIGSWDVRNVANFKRMLANSAAFNQPLGNWKFKSNANFGQFTSGTNGMSCQNYSSTILGWNFNNPAIENLTMGGFNADYDSTASRAKNELIARGWSMSGGTDIGGDCGTLYSFACTDSLTLGPDTLFGNLSLQAERLITLDSIVIDTDSRIESTAGGSIVMLPGFKVKTGSNYEAKIDVIDCPDYSTDNSPSAVTSALVNANTAWDLEIAEEKES